MEHRLYDNGTWLYTCSLFCSAASWNRAIKLLVYVNGCEITESPFTVIISYSKKCPNISHDMMVLHAATMACGQ